MRMTCLKVHRKFTVEKYKLENYTCQRYTFKQYWGELLPGSNQASMAAQMRMMMISMRVVMGMRMIIMRRRVRGSLPFFKHDFIVQ